MLTTSHHRGFASRDPGDNNEHSSDLVIVGEGGEEDPFLQRNSVSPLVLDALHPDHYFEHHHDDIHGVSGDDWQDIPWHAATLTRQQCRHKRLAQFHFLKETSVADRLAGHEEWDPPTFFEKHSFDADVVVDNNHGHLRHQTLAAYASCNVNSRLRRRHQGQANRAALLYIRGKSRIKCHDPGRGTDRTLLELDEGIATGVCHLPPWGLTAVGSSNGSIVLQRPPTTNVTALSDNYDDDGGRWRRRLHVASDLVTHILPGNGSSVVVSANDGSVSQIELAQLRVCRLMRHRSAVNAVAHVDPWTTALATDEPNIDIVDERMSHIPLSLPGHTQANLTVVRGDDGRLYSAGFDRLLVAHDLRQPVPQPIMQSTLSYIHTILPCAPHLLAVAESDDYVHIVDTVPGSGAKAQRVDLFGQIAGISVSFSATNILTDALSGQLSLNIAINNSDYGGLLTLRRRALKNIF
jgi:hypothetical protein